MPKCALQKNWARSRALGPSSVRAVHMSNSGCEQAAGQERSHAWNNQQRAVETGTRMRADQTAVRKRCLLANEEKGRRKILAGKEKQIWCYSPGLAKSRQKIQTAEQLTATGVQRGTQGIKEEKDEIWPVLTVHT
jgi:hypothetical protein